MSRKGNPQLVDLIMNNVISTSGYILLKYKEKIFSAKVDSNGDIVFENTLKFNSPSAFGKHIYNLGSTDSSQRAKQCAGWTSVKYCAENDFLQAKPLKFFRDQLLVPHKKKRKNKGKTGTTSTPLNSAKKKRKVIVKSFKPLDIEQVKLAEIERIRFVAKKAKLLAERFLAPQTRNENADDKSIDDGIITLPSLNAIAHNKAVYVALGETIRMKFSDLGTNRIQFDGHEMLLKSIREGFQEAKQDGRDGKLKIGDLFFRGYNAYAKTHVENSDFDGKEQMKFTTLIKREHLNLINTKLKGFKKLYDLCKTYSGDMQFLSTHILQQDSKHARFRWHRDTEQGFNHILTFVFMLSKDTNSSMQVAGFDEISYKIAGNGVVFPSDTEHRS